MSVKYVLFVTQFLKHKEQSGQTGGTISNYIFLKSLAKIRPVKVLLFDALVNHLQAFADDGIEVHAVPPPLWRGLQLAVNWVDFVKQETDLFIQRHGIPSDLLVTTSSLPALNMIRNPLETNHWVIVQAYENFGLKPPRAAWQTRLSLAKQALVRRFSDVRLMRQADGVITNSEFMRQAIKQRFRLEVSRIRIVPQVCDMQPVPKNFCEVGRTIGFVNRGSDKNFPFILDLARRAPDLSFLIYGHISEITGDMPTNIIIKGWATDRSAMYESAAVWLMPSAWPEPFGRVSIEAQAANRPVLVVNSGGLPETVNDVRYVINGFNPDDWLRAIKAILLLPVTVVEENGRKIRRNFSQDMLDAQLRNIFMANRASSA